MCYTNEVLVFSCLTIMSSIWNFRIIKNSVRMSVSAQHMSTQAYSFFVIFLKFIFAINFWVSKSFTIGETCSTNVPVHNTLSLVSSGLVTCALIVKNAGHVFRKFLSHFLRIGDV